MFNLSTEQISIIATSSVAILSLVLQFATARSKSKQFNLDCKLKLYAETITLYKNRNKMTEKEFRQQIDVLTSTVILICSPFTKQAFSELVLHLGEDMSSEPFKKAYSNCVSKLRKELKTDTLTYKAEKLWLKLQQAKQKRKQ